MCVCERERERDHRLHNKQIFFFFPLRNMILNNNIKNRILRSAWHEMLHLSNHWKALYFQKKKPKNSRFGMEWEKTHECIRPEKATKI